MVSTGPVYGQVVAGPPGSGKTTYCAGMQEYLRLLGRDAWVINLDPANEVPHKSVNMAKPSSAATRQEEKHGGQTSESTNSLPYETLLDVCDDVVNLSSVMKNLQLGPNGGLVYCMEYIEKNVDTIVELLQQRVKERSTSHPYLIFDLPGQVELYTHSNTIQKLFAALTKTLDMRLVAIQLIDAHYCTEAANFLSAALLATTTMIRLELPTVSILSKVDLLGNYGPLPFALDYFTECQGLDRLLPFLSAAPDELIDQMSGDQVQVSNADDYTDDPDFQKARRRRRMSRFSIKFEKLQKLFAEIVDDYGLLSFMALDISDAESVGRIVAQVDKCNGYVFTTKENSSINQDLFKCAVQSDSVSSKYETIATIQERLDAAREHERSQNNETI